MNYWSFLIHINSLIIKVTNFIFRCFSLLNVKQRTILFLQKNKLIKPTTNQVFIILNAPSLKEQDLSVLKGHDLIFVNRGFKHELYKQLQPKYQVFIDPKILSGTWPISWFDEILEINPKIKIVLPVSWCNIDMFQPYMTSIIWIDIKNRFSAIGVSGACFEFAISQNYKKLYFTGFDGNGIAHEMIKSQSHFYGSNEENNIKTTKNYIIDLFMHSRQFLELHNYVRTIKKKNIEIINLTNGGLLDMFPRQKLSDIR